MPWKGLYRVPLGLLNFNFAFMKITCALDVPCRRPEWLSGGEVEKRMVTPARSVCLRMASGLFRSANELHDTPRQRSPSQQIANLPQLRSSVSVLDGPHGPGHRLGSEKASGVDGRVSAPIVAYTERVRDPVVILNACPVIYSVHGPQSAWRTLGTARNICFQIFSIGSLPGSGERKGPRRRYGSSVYRHGTDCDSLHHWHLR